MSLMMRGCITLGLLAALVAGHAPGRDDDSLVTEAKAKLGVIAPVDPGQWQHPAVMLGRDLFWDERLSANQRIACATCHVAADGGADRRRFSIDARGRPTSRNSQTVFNAALQPKLRWVADRDSLAQQAERSLTGSMGFATPADVIAPLRECGYLPAFQAAFPSDAEPMTPANYGKAIAAYEATLLTPGPLDRFLGGEPTALTEAQLAGLRVFLRVGCADCHAGPLLGGSSLRKFGIVSDYWTATKSPTRDPGRFEATKVEADRYKFRVAMLRNIAQTGPYFHDGSVADLREAVQAMAEVQLGQRLSEVDATTLVAFLEALTGETPVNYGRAR